MNLLTAASAVVGITATIFSFAYVYRDAQGIPVSRPLLWACITAGPIALGTGLFVLTDAPFLGAIMTANTGTVLYGYEREVATETDETRDPHTLPKK